MKNELNPAWISLRQMLRFLTWYGIVIASAFLLLPPAAEFVNGQYEALSAITRLTAAAGLLAMVVAWQISQQWRRLRRARPPTDMIEKPE